MSKTNAGKAFETKSNFELGISSFSYADLYKPERLRELAETFYDEIKQENAELHSALMQYIAARGANYEQKVESKILTDAAPYLSNFIARLFNIEPRRESLVQSVKEQDPVWQFKFFIQRRAIKKFPAEQAVAFDLDALNASLLNLEQTVFADIFDPQDDELTISKITIQLLAIEEALTKKQELTDAHRDVLRKLNSVETTEILRQFQSDLNSEAEDDLLAVKTYLRLFEAWAAVHSFKPEAKRNVRGWQSFRVPHQLDYQNLVHVIRPRGENGLPELIQEFPEHIRRRDGFDLTDPRGTQREALYETDYCLICHERSKDSCSKGFHEKDGSIKRNPLGIKMTGCPLEEKISEMHLMKRHGDSIAALALVVIDNPMCAGTGHRICNDCMKGCIFQKQEPVNIPQAETSVLTDVLELPYGFEIYSLLTRWNPLKAKRPYALPYNGKNVLVVGMGPAGYTLAHYLLNEGFGVVGVDGLKIEPLAADLTGRNGKTPAPIKNADDLRQPLSDRILSGFGGVQEYGITVRWDKNFLTVLQLLLERHPYFRAYGGIRFGGTLTIEDAWDFGFDHIAIATGAGRPTIVRMKNNLIRGIRQASDFLMSLQLNGAFKKDTLANLQVRLPAVVIGGGLTGIDTATEIAAYYPVQVEKMLNTHEKLVLEIGETAVFEQFNEEELGIYQEFLAHGRAVREERERAEKAGEKPDLVSLVKDWGGVSLIYRKRMQDSPAYRLNHEEIQKALEEGINFIELFDPREAVPDEYNAVKALVFERVRHNSETGKFENTGETVEFPARTVCVAAGTAPNVIYEKEKPGTFKLDEWKQYFLPHKLVKNGKLAVVPAEKGETGFFTSYEENGKFITYYGDNHPQYAGNVVKAMASAKDGYEKVVEIFADEISDSIQTDETGFTNLIEMLEDQLVARVVRVERLTPNIVDVVVRAPLQARQFQPGQFYRLQNFETHALQLKGTKLLMENLALTGAEVDVEKGLLSMIVLEMGTSSRMCSLLEENEEVIVMGPTGTPTEIPENETVLLAGGGLGNAVLFSIAKAMRAKNNRIIYFAGYKDGGDIFRREEIENSVDQVIWTTDKGEAIEPHRPQDRHYRGNIVQAMLAYVNGEIGEPQFDLKTVDRIIAIGSDRMMNAVKEARHSVLAPYLKQEHEAIGSINSPMQCMMKEICAQCLQRHVDPHTGEESFVFSCFNQDQSLDRVDFSNLNERLKANSVQEKLSNLWLDKLFKEFGKDTMQSNS
ncbi:MAG TPA: FAD-dependent oxidoreductase [Pyrinomonadaceae bacterium]|jgi:NADPH-dependent glutamate synthase beta subunit-like oxidoreductase/NAD(P)H-flavin reductase